MPLAKAFALFFFLAIQCLAEAQELTEWESSSGTKTRGVFAGIDEEKGTITILIPREIELKKLSPKSLEAARALAQKKSASQPLPIKRRWICLTNHFQFVEQEKGNWVEIGMLNEKRPGRFRFVRSTEHFLEFKQTVTNRLRRIFPDHFEDFIDEKWVNLGSGKWRDEGKTPELAKHPAPSILSSAFVFTDETYGGDFVNERHRWIKSKGDGKPLLEFVEIGTSQEGLDLYCDARQQTFRIRKNDVLVIDNGKQEVILTGHWKHPSGVPEFLSAMDPRPSIRTKQSVAKPVSPPASTSKPTPGTQTITGDQWIGATSKEMYSKLTQYAVQQDKEAFTKLLTAGLLTGEMTMFKNGEEVLIADISVFSAMVKVRRKGDTKEYWTNTEATK